MRKPTLRKYTLLAGTLCVIGTAALALSLTGRTASAQQQPCDFLTSGGVIVTAASGTPAKANFAVAGGCKHGSPTWGHLQYQDKGNGLKAKGTSITAYMPEGPTGVDPQTGQPIGTRIICGTASTNLYGNVDFRVRARDRGEPGSLDEFEIRLKKGAVVVYETEPANQLDGGNIALHKPNPSTSGSFGGSCPAGDSPVQGGDVSVIKSTDTPVIVSEVRFQILVQNAGPGTATNVMVHDDLPTGASGTLTWTIDPAVPGCSISGGNTLDCAFPTLAAGADIMIQVTAMPTQADCPDALNNFATVSADGDPNPANNTSGTVVIAACDE
jgi:uncharacterized repeat protein (TIGR01451 family)